MSTMPARQPSSAPSVEQQFRRLEQLWKAETAFSSSDREIVGHPAFQEIIKLGDPVVPLGNLRR